MITKVSRKNKILISITSSTNDCAPARLHVSVDRNLLRITVAAATQYFQALRPQCPIAKANEVYCRSQ